MDAPDPCYFRNLPYECTWCIFEHLDVIALRETRTVSRNFKLFSDADRLWEHHALPLIQKETPANPPTSGFRSFFYQKRTFSYPFSSPSTGLPFPGLGIGSNLVPLS